MASAPVNRPKAIEYLNGGAPSMRQQQTDNNSSAFVAYQFVYLTGSSPNQKLTKCTASQSPSLVYGLSLEDASATGTGAANIPPAVLYAGKTSVLDTNDTYFLVNITDGSGTIGSGSTRQQDVTIGSTYEMIYAGSGDTATQMLNAAATTNTLFRVEAFWPEDGTGDFNGRVIVSLVGTRQ